MVLYPGNRVKASDGEEIYLIDPEGFRRYIPTKQVYEKLFKDWTGIIIDDNVLSVRAGPDIPPDARITKSATTTNLYFAESPVPNSKVKTYRWIISADSLVKFNFSIASLDVVDQAVIDSHTDPRFWAA